MDILPTEVVFYQTLLLVINFYLKLSNFIINYQSLLKTNNHTNNCNSLILLLLILQDYVVYQHHNDGEVLHNS